MRGSQIQHGMNLPPNWQNHVAERHSANRHPDWDRHTDHRWHGHHCRFVNGCWVIFDFGFYPWWPYWYDDGYPYPYGDAGAYQAESDMASTVAAVQEDLRRHGYYTGEIDGVFGPQTRRAISRYQAKHHLPASGDLTPDTLGALGLQ
jgi:Putative peptidoglycan binding domain